MSQVNVIDPIGGGAAGNIASAAGNLTNQALSAQAHAAQAIGQSRTHAHQERLQRKYQEHEQHMAEERERVAREHAAMIASMNAQQERNKAEWQALKESGDHESARLAAVSILEQAKKINAADAALAQAEMANTIIKDKQAGWLKDAHEHANTHALGLEKQAADISTSAAKYANRSAGVAATSDQTKEAMGSVGFWDAVKASILGLPGGSTAAIGMAANSGVVGAAGKGILGAGKRVTGAIEAGLDFDPAALQNRLRTVMADDFLGNVSATVPDSQRTGIAAVFKAAIDNLSPNRGITQAGVIAIKAAMDEHGVDPLTLSMVARGASSGFSSIVENRGKNAVSTDPKGRDVEQAMIDAARSLEHVGDNISNITGINPESYFRSLKDTIPSMVDKLFRNGPEVWSTIAKDMPPADVEYLTNLRNQYLEEEGNRQALESQMVTERGKKADAQAEKEIALYTKVPATQSAAERVRADLDRAFPGTRSALSPAEFVQPGGPTPPLAQKKLKPGTWGKQRPVKIVDPEDDSERSEVAYDDLE